MSNSTYLADDDERWSSHDSNGSKNEEEMKTKESNLYKVKMDGWSSAVYVAAENQQQAVEKVAPYYEIEEPEKANIQYVGDIII